MRILVYGLVKETKRKQPDTMRPIGQSSKQRLKSWTLQQIRGIQRIKLKRRFTSNYDQNRAIN